VRVIGLQAGFGPDRVTEELDGLADVSVLPPAGGIQAALEQLFSSWSANGDCREPIRERLARTSENTNGVKVSRHIERLWAAEEVARQLAGRQSSNAMLLATTHQVVTPASGAVVLETAAQYAMNGLNPADPATVPTVPMVPEPSTWAMLVMAGGIASALRWRRRFRQRHPG